MSVCRECGCTDERACVLYDGPDVTSTCWWVEPDLCSACVPDADPGWVRLPTARLIAQRIRRHTFRYSNEDELQELLETCLRLEGFDVRREVVIDRGRVDLLVERVGIEVKVDGDRGSVERQVRRYAASDDLDELVLVTSRVSHQVPDEVAGKPVQIVSLAEQGL